MSELPPQQAVHPEGPRGWGVSPLIRPTWAGKEPLNLQAAPSWRPVSAQEAQKPGPGWALPPGASAAD